MDFTSYAIYRKIISKKHVVDGTVLGSISFDLIWLKAKKAGHDIVETFTLAFLKDRILFFNGTTNKDFNQTSNPYKEALNFCEIMFVLPDKVQIKRINGFYCSKNSEKL